MNEPKYAAVLVESTSHALRVEKLLNDAGVPNKMIPVPRHLSSDCGACIRIAGEDEEDVRSTLEAARLCFLGIEPI